MATGSLSEVETEIGQPADNVVVHQLPMTNEQIAQEAAEKIWNWKRCEKVEMVEVILSAIEKATHPSEIAGIKVRWHDPENEQTRKWTPEYVAKIIRKNEFADAFLSNSHNAALKQAELRGFDKGYLAGRPTASEIGPDHADLIMENKRLQAKLNKYTAESNL
jgi:hypothetical protein